MAGTPFNASHPIQSLLGQSDSPDNPAKQLVATNNKDAIVTTSLKVLCHMAVHIFFSPLFFIFCSLASVLLFRVRVRVGRSCVHARSREPNKN